MSRLQEIATLALDVVDDATPVEAAMQADGDEPGLARHEAGPLSHQPVVKAFRPRWRNKIKSDCVGPNWQPEDPSGCQLNRGRFVP